jgi:hypothetical protein
LQGRTYVGAPEVIGVALGVWGATVVALQGKSSALCQKVCLCSSSVFSNTYDGMRLAMCFF